MKKLFISTLGLYLLIALSVPYSLAAQKAITFKLSVETNESHHRNKGLKIFRCLLEKNSKGRLKVDYYHSGQIYKGRDIPKALKIGTIEMAVPGIWQLEGIDSNTAITSLPMFYGLSENISKKLMDGEASELLNQTLENKLDVKILGKWYFHSCSKTWTKARPIKTLEDWKGLKIRYAAGYSSATRIKTLGGNPVRIPFPDLPMAMLQGTADGFITGFGSYKSAKLWETGTFYCTMTNDQYMHYIPMMNGKFWKSLPEDLQKVILDTWKEHVDMQRAITDYEQAHAVETILEHGVQIFTPPKEEMNRWRTRLMSAQDEIVEKLNMDKNFVAKVKKFVDEYQNK
ncbi:TRAP transporter substrate-binding protein DctP [Thermodesulfobacteriota bacterium]